MGGIFPAQTDRAQVIGNDFGGGISSFAFVEGQCIMETLCWNWLDPGKGVEGGERAVLEAPNRAGEEEQNPSPGHSTRSCSQTQMEGSSQWTTGIQSRRNHSAATEEFYLEGKEDMSRWRPGSLGQHGTTWLRLESSPSSNESEGSKRDQCGKGWQTLKEQEELPQSQKHPCREWPQPFPVVSKGRKTLKG